MPRYRGGFARSSSCSCVFTYSVGKVMQISMPPARPPVGTKYPGLGTPLPGGPSRRRCCRRAAPPPPGLCPRSRRRPDDAHAPTRWSPPGMPERLRERAGSWARGPGRTSATSAPPEVWAGPGRPRPTRKRCRTDSELGFRVTHLLGSPSRGASVWPSRTRAQRPTERGAREAQPWRAGGGAPGVDLGSEPPARGTREAAGPEATEATTSSGPGGGVVTSAPGLRPVWPELSPAHAPPRASRETEAWAGCTEARVGAES